jgi:hypothetical protein
MRIRTVDSTYSLPARKILRIEGGRGWTVSCSRGYVCVTQPGDLRDLFLSPGETLELSGNGLVLVEAWSDSTVVLEQPVRMWDVGRVRRAAP